MDKTGTYTFTATNADSATTGEMTVDLSETNADSFTLSKSNITDLAVSGSDTFTVVPNIGLRFCAGRSLPFNV